MSSASHARIETSQPQGQQQLPPASAEATNGAVQVPDDSEPPQISQNEIQPDVHPLLPAEDVREVNNSDILVADPGNEESGVVTVHSTQRSDGSSNSVVVKRRRTNRIASCQQPPASTKAYQEDTNCCVICLDQWSNVGPHQLCCMPCGHLFGYACIRGWILGGGRKARPCPTCKHPGRLKDVRLLFGLPTSLETADVSETVRLRKQIQEERTAHEKTKARLQEFKRLARTYREQFRDLQNSLPGYVQTFGCDNAHQPKQAKSSVRLISSRRTNGASVSVAFGTDASYLFNERVRENASHHRIGRVDLGRPQAIMHSPKPINNRVNAIEVCVNSQRADYKHIAIVSIDCKVTLLASNLQHASTLRTQAVPLSCTWLSSRPNLIAIGLVSGEVCMYDVRHTSTVLYKTLLSDFQGARAVHSVEEVYVGSVPVIMAASPLGIFGITFDGYMNSPRVREVRGGVASGWVSSSLTASENMIVVASRKCFSPNEVSQTPQCSLSVYKGLVETEDVLKLDDAVGDRMFVGSQRLPFVFGSLLGSEDHSDAILAYPDRSAQDKLATWSYNADKAESACWVRQETTCDVGTQTRWQSTAEVRATAGLRMPKSAKVSGMPEGTGGVFVTVGDDIIRVFASVTSQ